MALGLGFGLTVAAISLQNSATVEREPRGTVLGPVDVAEYCEAKYGPRAKAIHPSPGAYGWRCWVSVNGVLESHELDFDEACSLSYDSPAYADLLNFDDPYGWACRRGPK
jgi:hypothetical protein